MKTSQQKAPSSYQTAKQSSLHLCSGSTYLGGRGGGWGVLAAHVDDWCLPAFLDLWAPAKWGRTLGCQPEPGTTTCLPGYLLSSHLSRFQFLVWSAWCLTRDLRKPLPLQNSQEPYISLGTQCHKPENSGLSRKPASRCQLFNCKALR